ncbi:hypothetical protein ACF0H5_006887 [Mactra antiquata]
MHGRVKVKTTAEQQEAKRKEREKKLKIYTAATEKIFEKRKNKEYDEEALKITGEILAVNSDFSTFWNYRKEIFLNMTENKPENEMIEIFKGELQFLESCLRTNPKSYGVWNHRCFIMETMPKPDWKKELELCNLFLEYDERNFHCWDYRRFVVKKANISPEEELEFTTNKICNNFSNFSSWHYRSKLLPLIYPDENSTIGVEENILIKEYETVQNAFFTDPDDQSAWFYHRWLLGRGKIKTGVNCMLIDRTYQMLMINTTQPVMISPSTCEIDVLLNGERVEGTWRTHKQQTDVYSSIWIFKSTEDESWIPMHEDAEVAMAVVGEDWGSSDSVQINSTQTVAWNLTHEEQGLRFRDELSAATTDTLQRELDSIQELYELEPENKWVLLTIVSLMKALNPKQYANDIEIFLSKLITIDSSRINYYWDLRSKCLIENYLEELDFSTRVISLQNQNISCLVHPELFSMVVKIDLSNNKLDSVKGFSCFQCAVDIHVDGNQIKDLEELSFLHGLKLLSIKDNNISSLESLQPLGKTSILKLYLFGNPVVENIDELEVKKIIPSLHNFDGHMM